MYNKEVTSIIFKVSNFCFAVSILITYKLWFVKGFFPHVPLFNNHEIPFGLHLFLNGLFLILLLLNVVVKNRKILFLSIIFLIFILSLDRLKWQPWVYIFLLINIIFLVSKGKAERIKYLLIYLCIGIYVWAGIHKLNFSYKMIMVGIIPWMYENNFHLNKITNLFYAIPIIEIVSGLMLLHKKSRKTALGLIILLHISILIFLTIMSQNTNAAVIPWNIFHLVLAILLFQEKNLQLIKFRYDIYTFFLVLVVFIAPLFNYIDKWDNYLSFSVYSGKKNIYLVESADIEFFIAVENIYSEGETNFLGINDCGNVEYSLNELIYQMYNVPLVEEKDVLQFFNKYLNSRYEDTRIICLQNPFYEKDCFF